MIIRGNTLIRRECRLNALGMIEVNSIAAGLEIADVMLKTAGIKLIESQPVCPGKYIVLVQGGVSEVQSSLDAGVETAKENLVDKILIPNVHEQVFSAIASTTELKEMESIGVIETFSLASCIMVSDVAVKASKIDLVEIRLGRGLGGKSFVLMNGNVSSVKHSVETAKSLYEEEGMIARTVVIPSPHKDLINAIL